MDAIEIVSGGGQQARLGTALDDSLVVRAVDAEGAPVDGVTVVFAAAEGHGTADPAEAVTDGAGLARTLWTLGDAPGAQTLTASVAGGPSAQIAARGLTAAELVHAIEVVSGHGQQARIGVTLDDSVVVQAVDAEGAPVEGVTVVFAADEGHGTADPAQAVTDDAGLARTLWTLGDIAGTQTLAASVAGGPSAAIAARGLTAAEVVHAIEIVSGADQQARLGTVLDDSVVVRSVDAGGAPVEGVTVVFAAGKGHGTADPAEAVTDTAGLARTLWTLGDAPGAQTLAASVADGPSAEIAARGLTAAEVVHAIEIVSGDGQQARLGVSLDDSVVVRAVDAGGSPVEGVTVVFAAGEGHGTADPAEAVTDTAGLARTVWTLGDAPGAQTLAASVADGPSAKVGARGLTATEVVHAIEVVSGGGQTADLGAALDDSVVVRAVDTAGAPVEGAAVAFTPGEGHGTVDPAKASTDGEGLARTLWTLGKDVGEQTLVAAAGDVSETILAQTINPDRAALEALYSATRGEGWVNNDNWLTDAPLSEWYGVGTDGPGRVIGLRLEQNGLAGVIPPELARLDRLEVLSLGDNGLTGPIPVELGDLAELWYLGTYQNHLDGLIPPELGNLASLRQLHLNHNQLTGPIPPELANLSHLRSASIEANELTGPIPPELGNLSDLLSINLLGNQLTGPIPPELGNLDELTGLRLGENQLSGPIPPELGNLTELTVLWLADNQLTGPIPPELGSLDKLTSLWLGGNQLTGSIPPELGKLASMLSVWLHDNMLSGSVPSELGNFHNLVVMHLNGNELTGPLPRSFLGLQKLEVLTIEYGGRGNAGLCVPATAEFREWSRQVADRGTVDRLPGPFCDAIDRQALEALYGATRGAGWTRSDGWLEDDYLGQWWGVQVDAVGRVSVLDVAGNGLSGHLPEALGRLANLRELRMGGNPLVGRLPLSLAGVPLEEFDYGGTSLCVADDAEFGAWLNDIPRHSGTGTQCPPLTDREILELLYRNADGPNWSESAGWLTDAPLAEWHGVETDAAGRVVELRLWRNGLSGSLPVELGQLSDLRGLDLGSNGLSGSIPPGLGGLDRLALLNLGWNELDGGIPPELGRLSELRRLILGGNRLSGSVPPQLGALGRLEQLSLGGNRLSGEIPKEIGRLANLRTLSIDRNYLTGPIPPELGALDRLESLRLPGNQLEGGIPRDLGGLSALTDLILADNRLTGPIPPDLGALGLLERLDLRSNEIGGGIPSEIGKLGTLESMLLADNRLTGAIPPELGGLASLTEFDLTGNQLSGPIPAELGDLASLATLDLGGNELSGAIPGELGDLANLVTLNLGGNELSGALPAGLGRATRLEDLDLRSNALAGPVPPEYGNLTALTSLILANNAGLAGPMPSAITALGRLERFMAGGTGLCRPAESRFDAWFGTIGDRRLARCVGGPSVYLTQTVQSWDDPVPLLVGKAALLRVFVTAPEGSGATMPEVRATFHVNGAERHVARIPAKAQPIPTEVTEGALALSANAEIPDWLIVPGLEMVIEVDPDGTLAPALGVTKRIPAEGRMAVDVRSAPPFNLTLIPFLHESEPNSSIVETVLAMAEDPHGHELFRDARTLLPISEFNVVARDPIVTSSKNPREMIAQVRATRLMEGGTGHWMGIFPESDRSSIVSWPSGVAAVGGHASVSEPNAGTIAHELGHNLGLRHAPCACAGVDPWFPHPGGRIGAYGYDDGRNELVPPHAADVMSYCRNGVYWISDYFFNKALNFRLATAATEATAAADRVRTLLVWGGRNEDGAPYLDPAFVVDAVSALPAGGGEYAIEGATDDGTLLFSFPFDMPVNPDAIAQEAGFVFTLPVQPGWEDDLASITLSGPGGSVTLDDGTNRPMAILRDPQTGQVRGFLSDVPAEDFAQTAAARATAATQPLQVLISRGIPDAAAWRR